MMLRHHLYERVKWSTNDDVCKRREFRDYMGSEYELPLRTKYEVSLFYVLVYSY